MFRPATLLFRFTLTALICRAFGAVFSETALKKPHKTLAAQQQTADTHSKRQAGGHSGAGIGGDQTERLQMSDYIHQVDPKTK